MDYLKRINGADKKQGTEKETFDKKQNVSTIKRELQVDEASKEGVNKEEDYLTTCQFSVYYQFHCPVFSNKHGMIKPYL